MNHQASSLRLSGLAMIVAMVIVGFTNQSGAQFRRPGQQSSSSDRDTARVKDFYTKLDANRNGQIEPDEYKRSFMRRTIEQRFREAGLDPNKPVPLNRFLEKRLTGSSTTKSRTSSTSSSGTSVKNIYRMRSAHERLPKNIPQWFRDKDKNLDGQVAMPEYDTDWTDRKVAEFRKYDLDGDFVITPKELVAILDDKAGAKRSSIANDSPTSSEDSSKTPDEVASAPAATSSSKSGDATSVPRSSNTNSSTEQKPATDTSKIDPRILSYAQGVIAKYDANKDNQVTPTEWTKFPKKADVNGDGAITAQEYAASLSR